MRRTATFMLAALALFAGTTVSGSSPLARLRAHTSPVAAPASPAAMMVGSDACNGQDYGTAGQFDFYVFAQSWPAEFCQAKPSWPGCQSPTQWQRTKLTLHGMWPNYNSKQSGHGWPQCCQSPAGSDLDPSVVRALLSDLQTYWPNEQDPSGNNLAKSLWAHEWNKHGTCSGLDQKSYFQQAMEMERSMPTPSVITQNVGSSVSLSDLKSAYNAGNCLIGGSCMTGFNCDVVNGQQYLSGITTCWDTNFNQIQCGPATLGSQGQQCTASTINIRSF